MKNWVFSLFLAWGILLGTLADALGPDEFTTAKELIKEQEELIAKQEEKIQESLSGYWKPGDVVELKRGDQIMHGVIKSITSDSPVTFKVKPLKVYGRFSSSQI